MNVDANSYKNLDSSSSADPDADRPCSCEESERLRARVRELQAMNATQSEDLHSLAVRVRDLEAELDGKYATLVRVADEKRSGEARIRELEGHAENAGRLFEARVRELASERDQYKGFWQIECDRTVRALEHQATAESESRALREKVERAVAVLAPHQGRNETCRMALEVLCG